MPTEIDSNGNYAPVLRHPDLPSSAAFNFGGSINGGLQTNDVIYESTDPTTEGLTPPDPTLASTAYKRDGTGPMYSWNPTNSTWN